MFFITLHFKQVCEFVYHSIKIKCAELHSNADDVTIPQVEGHSMTGFS